MLTQDEHAARNDLEVVSKLGTVYCCVTQKDQRSTLPLNAALHKCRVKHCVGLQIEVVLVHSTWSYFFTKFLFARMKNTGFYVLQILLFTVVFECPALLGSLCLVWRSAVFSQLFACSRM